MNDSKETALINQKLPEEMLEKIFSFTSQYKDYINISEVCVKWYRIIVGLRQLNKATFNESLENGQIYWKCFENKFSPTQRHSHSSARVGDRLFIFGGLSGTTTSYNDFWVFDLNTKTWYRPTTTGAYPSPKAAASLLSYNNESLILFGGYSHPYSYPFNQQVSFFDELHIYNKNKDSYLISQILFSQEAPKLAGHTASIIDKNKMILFGGCNGSLGNKTNSVHCLELDTYNWINITHGNATNNINSTSSSAKNATQNSRQIDGFRPEARYGHSQITLDDERVLIIGGCGGPNKQYDDVWILNWPKDSTKNAYWQQILILNHINSPSQLYCISFVRCENKLITFGKPRMPPATAPVQSQSSLHGLISEAFQVNGKCSNGENPSNPVTISGHVNKTAQPRKCSCTSSLTVEKPLNSNSNSNGSSKFNLPKSNSSSSLLESSLKSSESASSISENDIQIDENKRNQANSTDSSTQMTILNKSQRNTIKRLEALKKIATKFNKLKDEKELKIMQQLNTTTSLSKSQNQCVVHSKVMQTFVLNLSPLFKSDSDNKFVEWHPPIAQFDQAPPDTILYSLTSGIDEIILFGGMELESPHIHLKPSYDFIKHRISNKVYIMKPNTLHITSL